MADVRYPLVVLVGLDLQFDVKSIYGNEMAWAAIKN